MIINQRTFSANVGDSSVGNAGPDAIEQDIDNLMANDQELLNMINSQASQIDFYGVASGTNTYVATVGGYTLEEGKTVRIKFTNANTGASTLNINTLGAKNIVKSNGSALSSGNIKAGQVCNLVYTGSVFQLLGEGGEYGTATSSDVLSGKTIGTEGGLVSGTIPSKGAATYSPSTSAQTITAGQYLSGAQTISAVVGTAVVGDVLAGKTFNSASGGINVTGTMVNRGAVTSTITTQGGQYTIPAGYHSGSGKITASFANLIASNIKAGVNIGGIIGELLIPIPYGSVWTQRTSSFSTTDINSVAYGNGLWVAVGDSGQLATSSNGTSWTQRTSSFSVAIFCVAYGNGLWVAGGSGGKLATSTDGITWTQRTSSFETASIRSVAYGNGLWVAVGGSGKLATSTDGITWTQRTSSFDTSTIRGVCYGQGMFVAVGFDGKLATSSNGTSWTQRTSRFSTSDIYSVAYGNGLWVAAGDDGKLATSSDGTSWTQETSSFETTDIIYSVAYGDGLWVAGGSGGKLAISSNGTSWTQETSSFETTLIGSVAYGNVLWVAAGDDGKLATLS